MKSLDVVALGSCYVDINASQFPLGAAGIPLETEPVGGAYETVPGGSAVNFCCLLASLDLDTAFIGMAGTDRMGDMLADMLQESGVRPELIRRTGLLTNISFNMTSPKGSHILCVAGTASAALTPKEVLPRLEELAAEAKMIFFGGCFKLRSFADAFDQVVATAARHSAALVVDHNRIPKNTPPEMLEAVKRLVLGAQYYFPSRDEFCQLWHVDDIEAGLRLLYERSPELVTVVKDGENGAYYWADNTLQHVPALKVETIDNATGAGDSFNAGMIVAIIKGRSLNEAVRYGCIAGAAKVGGQPLPRLP